MSTQLANMSTDLRRISYWILAGRDDLISQVIDQMKDKYSIKGRVGIFSDIWLEINKLLNSKANRYRKADYASTLSSILLQETLKIKCSPG